MSNKKHFRYRMARNSIIWAVVSFIILQLGFAVVLEEWLPQFRDPIFAPRANDLKDRLERMAASKNPPAVLITMLGSSRTAHGLRGETIETELRGSVGQSLVVYNLGTHGTGPARELVNLERLLALDIRPDWLLIEVWPPLMAGTPSLEILFMHLEQMGLHDLSVLDGGRWRLSGKMRRSWLWSWIFPWYSQRFLLLESITDHLFTRQSSRPWFRRFDSSGWLPDDEALASERIEQSLKYWKTSLQDFHLGEPSCQGLRSTLEKCKKENIPALLVIMPESTDLRSCYAPEAWQEVASFLEALCKQYEIALIDARNWVADQDFVDAIHLAPSGAYAFSHRLGQEVLLPRLKHLQMHAF